MLRHVTCRAIAVCIVLVASALVSAASVCVAADFHHVHLNVPDPAAAARWYTRNLGGRATKVAGEDAVAYGSVTIQFSRAAGEVAGSVGSVVDHVGFAYPDIVAKMKELAASDVEIVSGVEQEGPIKYAFIRDPWNTLIEIVEDPQINGFHHIHLATTNPKESLAWYRETLGGESARFGGILPGVRYGDAWVLAKGVKERRAATKGRSIDHVSWAVGDIDAARAKLTKMGATAAETTSVAGPNAVIVDAPDGVRIELTKAER